MQRHITLNLPIRVLKVNGGTSSVAEKSDRIPLFSVSCILNSVATTCSVAPEPPSHAEPPSSFFIIFALKYNIRTRQVL